MIIPNAGSQRLLTIKAAVQQPAIPKPINTLPSNKPIFVAVENKTAPNAASTNNDATVLRGPYLSNHNPVKICATAIAAKNKLVINPKYSMLNPNSALMIGPTTLFTLRYNSDNKYATINGIKTVMMIVVVRINVFLFCIVNPKISCRSNKFKRLHLRLFT